MSLRILLSCSAERLRPSPSERPRLPVATAAQPPALYAFVAEMIVPWLNSTTLDTSASFIPLSRSLTARRRRSLSASTESVLPSVRSMPHSTHLEKKLQQFLAGSISKFLQAWGNQYSFCNNRKLWDRLDRQVDDLIGRHLSLYRKARARLEEDDGRVLRRRLLGVRSL